tara:strand:+ start:334 stop:525 length:192 start_codon:yes stop_codon:yes gene_type:complete
LKTSILIVGCNGQDGRILTDLLSKKYNLYGFTRKKNSSQDNLDKIKISKIDGKNFIKIRNPNP